MAVYTQSGKVITVDLSKGGDFTASEKQKILAAGYTINYIGSPTTSQPTTTQPTTTQPTTTTSSGGGSSSTTTAPKGWEYYGKLNDPSQVSNYLNTQSGFSTSVSGNKIVGTKNGVQTTWTFNGTDWVSSATTTTTTTPTSGGTTTTTPTAEKGWEYWGKVNDSQQVSNWLNTQPGFVTQGPSGIITGTKNGVPTTWNFNGTDWIATTNSTTPSGSGGSTPSTYTGSSLVDYLTSIGKDSSYAARTLYAQQYGISNYTGTAEQNTQILNQLKQDGATSANPNPGTTPAVNNSLPVNASGTKYYSTSTNNVPSYTFIANSTNTPYGHQEITKAEYIAGLQSKLNEAQAFITKYDTTNPSAIVPKDKTGWDGRNYTGATYTQADVANFQKLITDAGGTPTSGTTTTGTPTNTTTTTTPSSGWAYYGKLNNATEVSKYLNAQPGFNTQVASATSITGTKDGISTTWKWDGENWFSSNTSINHESANTPETGWTYYAKLNNPAKVSAYLNTQSGFTTAVVDNTIIGKKNGVKTIWTFNGTDWVARNLADGETPGFSSAGPFPGDSGWVGTQPTTTTPATENLPNSTPDASGKGWEYYGKLNDPTQVSAYLNKQTGFATSVSGTKIVGTKNGVQTTWTFNGTDWVSSNAPASTTTTPTSTSTAKSLDGKTEQELIDMYVKNPTLIAAMQDMQNVETYFAQHAAELNALKTSDPVKYAAFQKALTQLVTGRTPTVGTKELTPTSTELVGSGSEIAPTATPTANQTGLLPQIKVYDESSTDPMKRFNLTQGQLDAINGYNKILLKNGTPDPKRKELVRLYMQDLQKRNESNDTYGSHDGTKPVDVSTDPTKDPKNIINQLDLNDDGVPDAQQMQPGDIVSLKGVGGMPNVNLDITNLTEAQQAMLEVDQTLAQKQIELQNSSKDAFARIKNENAQAIVQQNNQNVAQISALLDERINIQNQQLVDATTQVIQQLGGQVRQFQTMIGSDGKVLDDATILALMGKVGVTAMGQVIEIKNKMANELLNAKEIARKQINDLKMNNVITENDAKLAIYTLDLQAQENIIELTKQFYAKTFGLIAEADATAKTGEADFQNTAFKYLASFGLTAEQQATIFDRYANIGLDANSIIPTIAEDIRTGNSRISDFIAQNEKNAKLAQQYKDQAALDLVNAKAQADINVETVKANFAQQLATMNNIADIQKAALTAGGQTTGKISTAQVAEISKSTGGNGEGGLANIADWTRQDLALFMANVDYIAQGHPMTIGGQQITVKNALNYLNNNP